MTFHPPVDHVPEDERHGAQQKSEQENDFFGVAHGGQPTLLPDSRQRNDAGVHPSASASRPNVMPPAASSRREASASLRNFAPKKAPITMLISRAGAM